MAQLLEVICFSTSMTNGHEGGWRKGQSLPVGLVLPYYESLVMLFSVVLTLKTGKLIVDCKKISHSPSQFAAALFRLCL